MTKTCTACGEEKPVSSFHKNGVDKTGAVAYRPDCKECYNITRNLKKRHKIGRFVSHTKNRTGEVATLTSKDWRDALIHFRGRCAYCGVRQNRKIKLTKDHVIPVSKGGKTTRNNMIPACTACNCSKSGSDMEPWFRKQAYFLEERLELIGIWTSYSG